MTETSQQRTPRILVIEDDADQRALVCEAMRLHYEDHRGESIVAVGSAQDALRLDLGKFDIVLQDYNLPDMKGLDLLQAICTRADLPVIVVTGENVSNTAAEAIRCGAADYVVKLGDYLFSLPVLVDKNIRQHHVRQENINLQRQLEAKNRELLDKNVQLQESMEQLRKMATTDHLTGLSNRRHFGDLLERSFSEALRYHFDLSCCMCDLDHYKQLNDTLGHQAGDKLLMVTAEVIRSSMRSSDVAARYGGDEFVMLLPHTSIDRAVEVCDRIRRQLVLQSPDYCQGPRAVTMSVGIASLESHNPGNADALVALADRALYVAKENGKDQIVAFGSCRPQQA